MRFSSCQKIEYMNVQVEDGTYYSDRINEKISLHTDRDFYIAGEKIWFRIYLLEESTLLPLGFSKVAYVELLNNRNEIISRRKIKINHSGGSGYLDTPGDIYSGYYFIRSYTHWMKNYQPDCFFMTALAIVNPVRGLYENIDTATSPALVDLFGLSDEMERDSFRFDMPEEHLIIKINGNNSVYKCREKVSLEIATTGINGNSISSDISVSVFYSGDKQFHPPDIQDYLVSYSEMNSEKTNPDLNSQRQLYFAEMEGITISGRIIDPSTHEPVSALPVFLSIAKEVAYLESCLTHENGRFYFSLDDIYGDHEMVLSYPNQAGDFLIIVDEPYSEDFIELPELRLNLDQSWKSFIERQMINFQLNSIYMDDQESHINEERNRDQQPFYIKSDFTIRMEDYIQLPNMEEVFRELVKQVLVTRENSQLKLNVLDLNTNRIIGPDPVFIVDGVPFFDSGLIFELNPEDIAQIDIVSHKYYKGILEMDGIIDIRTNKENLPISEWPENTYRQVFQAYQQVQEYIAPDYSEEQKIKNRIPDFRNLLYWNPSVKTKSEGKGDINFFTSDCPGKYLIRIECMSDNGLFGILLDSLIVKK
jgi:hypothetical protein